MQIREGLRIMGITPRSVFPDLGGLSQELSGREYMIGVTKMESLVILIPLAESARLEAGADICGGLNANTARTRDGSKFWRIEAIGCAFISV